MEGFPWTRVNVVSVRDLAHKSSDITMVIVFFMCRASFHTAVPGTDFSKACYGVNGV